MCCSWKKSNLKQLFRELKQCLDIHWFKYTIQKLLDWLFYFSIYTAQATNNSRHFSIFLNPNDKMHAPQRNNCNASIPLLFHILWNTKLSGKKSGFGTLLKSAGLCFCLSCGESWILETRTIHKNGSVPMSSIKRKFWLYQLISVVLTGQ